MSKPSGPESFTLSDADLYYVFRHVYPGLLDALHAGDLEGVKQAFTHLQKKDITLELLDDKIEEISGNLDHLFSACLLKDCAISGNVEVLHYLTQEQKIPLDGRCISGIFAAIDCGHHDFAQVLYSSAPNLHSSEFFQEMAVRTFHATKSFEPFILKISKQNQSAYQEHILTMHHAYELQLDLASKIAHAIMDVRIKHVAELKTSIESKGKLFEELLEEVNELVNLSIQAKDYLLQFPGIGIEVNLFRFHAQSMLLSLNQKILTISTLKTGEEHHGTCAQIQFIIHHLYQSWDCKIEEIILKRRINEDFFKLLSKVLFGELPALIDLIRTGNTEGFKAYIEFCRTIGITLNALDQAAMFALEELENPFAISLMLVVAAADYGEVDIMRFLLDQNIVPTYFMMIALEHAVKYGQESMVEFILEIPEIRLNYQGLLRNYSNACVNGFSAIAESLNSVLLCEGLETTEQAAQRKVSVEQNKQHHILIEQEITKIHIQHFQNIEMRIIELQNALSGIIDLDLQSNAKMLGTVIYSLIDDIKLWANHSQPNDICLISQSMFMTKALILQIQAAFEKVHQQEDAEKLMAAKRILDSIVEELAHSVLLNTINETIEAPIPEVPQVEGLPIVRAFKLERARSVEELPIEPVIFEPEKKQNKL